MIKSRAWKEEDWDTLFSWRAEGDTMTTREYVEANTPYRIVMENGSGPVAMVGWQDQAGVPFLHVVIAPNKRSFKTWNEVYDLATDTLREVGYKTAFALVEDEARIGKLIQRKGWEKASLYHTEL